MMIRPTIRPLSQHASRSILVILFLLSLLTWVYVPVLLAWELSIVTTQLGHLLALIVVVAMLPLKPWRIRWAAASVKQIDTVFTVLGLAALITFLMPLITTVVEHPGDLNLAQLFKPGDSRTPFKRFSFMAANGKTPLNLDYYPPTENMRSPSPWILVIHGGGWINGDSEQLPELNWHLNRLGYGVISVDYRLSPGWLWPAPKDDILAALEFIKSRAAEWNLDPNRWVSLGRSAGAQIAGVVSYSLRGEARPKGYISFYGPSDLVFGYNVGEENDILRSRTLLRGFLGGTPAAADALYKSASVMNEVTRESCPTLLLHGRDDSLVFYRHSQRLITVLEAQRVDAQLVTVHFGPHGFDYIFNGPEAQVSTASVDRFLKRVLPHAL